MPFVSSGSWSPCAPLVWSQGFPTPLGGSSISTNPVKVPDIDFSSSQFRKQHPQCEKTNHIKEAEARIELTLHYGTPYPRLTNLPPNTLAAHMNTSTKGSTPPPSSSESFTTTTTNNSNSVHEKSRISRRTERALYESVPAYLKSYTYRPKK
ncbi:unnamed protein product [Schistosoma curassoni]|uniref:Uncharacterized protein n=1 Tax=Schistosoma curassoni TaxID=6186 RepID=A0A183K1P0_9TREM|nr:unnamed protein product [Schistosoma curassoni]